VFFFGIQMGELSAECRQILTKSINKGHQAGLPFLEKRTIPFLAIGPCAIFRERFGEAPELNTEYSP
jgi:hypothetical protein